MSLADRARVEAVLLSLCAVLIAASARADGSYPDALQILLPKEQPERIIVATSFGLIASDDRGRKWSFSCEQSVGAYGGAYLLGSGQTPRLFAVAAGAGVLYSDNGACSWLSAAGTLTDVVPYSIALDPSNAQRVHAIGVSRQDVRGAEKIFLSDDGGLTFRGPTFEARERSALLNVLVAPSQPLTVFASMFAPGNEPILLGSDDGGESWQQAHPLASSLGNNPFELLAVDASDPQRLFVRVLGPSSEDLAISSDGGQTFVRAVTIPGKLRAFLQLESGVLLVGGTAGTEGVAYRSTNDGESFVPWVGAPRVHALAERDGKLYVAADNFLDGYAIGESNDEGLTITPLAGFRDVSAVNGCVRESCAATCQYYADTQLWPQAVCGEPAKTDQAMGGAAGSSGSDAPELAGGQDAGQGGREVDETPPARPRTQVGGCACDVAGASTWAGQYWLALVPVLLACLRLRRPGSSSAPLRPSR